MSAVKPTREGPARPIPTAAESAGVPSGDNVDWPTGPDTFLPPGTDPGDILAWDGDSWEVLPVGADGEVLTADSGETLGLDWDSASGNFLLRVQGGAGEVDPLGSVGTNQVLDVGGANYFTLTLTASITVGFTGWPASGDISEIGVRITEDGTGGWTPTFTGISWVGGSTPAHVTTAGSTTDYVFWTTDGGSTIYGGQVGSGGGSGTAATTVTDETSLGITPAVGTDSEYARQDHTHGSPDTDAIKDAGRWELAVIPGSPPDPLYADGDYLYIWVP